MIMLAGNILL